jgi:hypothetical protein
MFKQFFFIAVGIILTLETAKWPGLEHQMASLTLLAFAYAFLADSAKKKDS